MIAYLALFFALGGTATAATGGTFILGEENVASSRTDLRNKSGVAMAFSSKSGRPPFVVKGNTTKVPYLNADRLDGVDSSSFVRKGSETKVAGLNADLLDGVDSAALQRRISAGCGDGQSIKSVDQNGIVACSSLFRAEAGATSADFIGAWVNCPSGYKVTGGGFSLDPATPDTVIVDTSMPWPANNVAGEGWYIHTTGGAPALGSKVYALCIR